MLHQQRDILPAVPQWRQIDIDNVEPVVEIFPEFALFHHLAKIRVGGGQNADVHLRHVVRAERRELLLLDHAQQFRLRLGADGAHFVEENGAFMRDFEGAFLVVNRACEGALHMSEQRGFQQFGRQRAAVHGHERMVHAGRIGVDGLGDQLFSGAGFARDQNSGAAGRHLHHQIEHAQHALALADDIRETVPLFQRPFELRVFVEQPLAGDDPLDLDQQFLVVPGLWQVVVGAQFHRLNGGFHRAVSRDHEDRRVAVAFAHVAKDFHAGFFRHHQIEQHQIVSPLFQPALALGAVLRQIDFVTLQIEQRSQTFANIRLVVDDENPSLHRARNPVARLRHHACTALRIAGNSKWKHVPSPGLDNASIAPPCS